MRDSFSSREMSRKYVMIRRAGEDTCESAIFEINFDKYKYKENIIKARLKDIRVLYFRK